MTEKTKKWVNPRLIEQIEWSKAQKLPPKKREGGWTPTEDLS